MEINKLVDLNNLRTAPQLSNSQEKKLLEENILKIRNKSNISIESKRSSKQIGSSLEAAIKINLKKDLYEIAKNLDFSEICITSKAELVLDDNLEDDIFVETKKASGDKCKVCWKISENKCERHG